MIQDRFGVFSVGPHLVGIPAAHVREMFVLPAVHRPTGDIGNGRGLTKLRDMVLPTLDLRVSLGMEPAAAELEALIQLLEAREQDHREWLDELAASVEEERAFTLATDPRKCHFGQWFYSYQAADGVLRLELSRIEQPHARVHALAHEVEELLRKGNKAAAHRVIDEARRGVLLEVVKQFDAIRAALRREHREIGVAIDVRGQQRVLVVDSAEAVALLEQLSEADDPLARGDLQIGLCKRMGRWKDSTKPVLLVDLDALVAA